MRKATYSVVQERPNLIIRDEGPWDYKLTVTNDIENVIRELVEDGLLPFNTDRSFYYYDSMSVFTGVIIDRGKFVKFFNPNVKMISIQTGQLVELTPKTRRGKDALQNKTNVWKVAQVCDSVMCLGDNAGFMLVEVRNDDGRMPDVRWVESPTDKNFDWKLLDN